MTRLHRRTIFQLGAATVAGALVNRTAFGQSPTEKPRHKVERLGIAVIGMRYQGSVIAKQAQRYGDIVSVCDVDQHVLDQGRASFGNTPTADGDYRRMLDRKGIDVVLIGTPDHWHTKMLIDAVAAGKDVYCEKPLTLTIDEGKLIRERVGESDRVVQVGTWQRSDQRFRLAAEMVRNGRIGKLTKVVCSTDANPTGGPFKPSAIPKNLNWDLWQGQTPDIPYVPERCHYTFRWWYETSGGKMTDWGAHHIDIAQWAINGLPIEIDGKGTPAKIADGYNVHARFQATIRYDNDVVMEVIDDGRNGIMFEGTLGRIFVNRGTIAGQAVDQLESNPMPRETFNLYANDNLSRPPRSGKLEAIENHMGNFFDCIESRKPTLSDIESQHRSVTTCHLANLSIRLGRPIRWDPVSEQIVGDAEAATMQSRPQREGFEIV